MFASVFTFSPLCLCLLLCLKNTIFGFKTHTNSKKISFWDLYSSTKTLFFQMMLPSQVLGGYTFEGAIIQVELRPPFLSYLPSTFAMSLSQHLSHCVIKPSTHPIKPSLYCKSPIWNTSVLFIFKFLSHSALWGFHKSLKQVSSSTLLKLLLIIYFLSLWAVIWLMKDY